MSEPAELSPVEKIALGIARATNENGATKFAQTKFLRYVSQKWIKHVISRRIFSDNWEWIKEFAPDRGVVLAANHRSFFDQYVILMTMFESGINWPKRLFFPVRSNFFYEKFTGLVLNAFIGGMVMYPPIFRDRSRAKLNDEALNIIETTLDEPGTLVGIHPEGTRGKGPDPYTLLKAQPGIGQIVLKSKPIVLPVFINGLGNDFVADVKENFSKKNHQQSPIILCFGKPVDYSEYTSKKPRAALYKRCADKIRADIIELGNREKEIRAQCQRGEISNSDPRWLTNILRNK